jgi:hypothetical protein
VKPRSPTLKKKPSAKKTEPQQPNLLQPHE